MSLFGQIVRSAIGACVAVACSAAPSLAATISVNFNGGNGNTVDLNGPTVTGTAGAVPAGNWNNAPGFSGSNLPLIDGTGAAAGNLSFNASNVYGATPAGPGTSGGPGDTALMTGQLDNFERAGAFATVSGLGPEFTAGGFQVLVYHSADSGGAYGFQLRDGITASDAVVDTRYGRQFGGNGTNYPLAGGINGYIGSTSTNTVGTDASTNYVILGPFNSSSFTLTGIAGSTGDGRPRPNGFQIVSVPEPASLGLVALGGLGLLARRRRA